MDTHAKQKTLCLLSNGMYVITSSARTKYGAATVTWLIQASFKPPLVVIALRPESSVFACLLESRCAAVHILDSAQKGIARKFFAPTNVEDEKINGEPFVRGTNKSPILVNLPVNFECLVKEISETGGDHTLVVMEVVGVRCPVDIEPLLIADSPWHYGG